MKNLNVNYSNLEKVISLSKEIDDEIESSYKVAKELEKYLKSAKWSGKTKISFEASIGIIVKYHKDLKDIVNKHTKAVVSLKSSIDNFNNTQEVFKIKRL